MEREVRLQQINTWITAQSLWMDSAQTPHSLTDLQRSMNTCQVRGHICNSDDLYKTNQMIVFSISWATNQRTLKVKYVSAYQELEEKIKLKSSALQELRDKQEGASSQDFVCQTELSSSNCAALIRQVTLDCFHPFSRQNNDTGLQRPPQIRSPDESRCRLFSFRTEQLNAGWLTPSSCGFLSRQNSVTWCWKSFEPPRCLISTSALGFR